MNDPLFTKVDCLMLKVDNLDAALRFYSEALGHPVLWRRPEMAGLGMPGTDAELVLHTTLGPEVDLLVANVDKALKRFDIPIGRCAVVRDPFGNAIVMLDQTKGRFVTNAVGEVIRVEKS
jgi:catechol 2,3-dioxygenase-like lactoylglutathione lyase family enzyme